MVGFVMYSRVGGPKWGWWICRLMVDQTQQGRATAGRRSQGDRRWSCVLPSYLMRIPWRSKWPSTPEVILSPWTPYFRETCSLQPYLS